MIGRCLGCDYPLVGLVVGPRPETGRCPECGRRFDPTDRSTINTGPPLGRLGRWALAPIGWPTYACALAPFAWVFWIATSPQLYYMFGEYFLCVPALLAVGLVYAVRFLARWHAAHSAGLPQAAFWVDRRRWRGVWYLAGVAVLIVVLKVPMRVGFLLSRPALERIAKTARANPAAAIPSRAGIYEVLSADDYGPESGHSVLICTSDEGGGFRYSPEGPTYFGYNPGDEGHLSGPWYWYSSD